MGIIRPVSILILSGVTVVAYLALHKQAKDNGFIVLEDVFVFKEKYLAGTKIPIRIPTFGHDMVNNYFRFMMHFFWGALDPKNVRAHLHANHMLGSIGSIFLVELLEAHRGASSTTFLFLTYFLQFFGEMAGIGLSTPIWCVLHLLLTPAPTSQRNPREALTAPRGHLQALGYAFLFGHIAPAVFLVTTQPDGEGWASQQLWTILRLFHPFFVVALFNVFTSLQRAGAGVTTTTTAPTTAAVALDDPARHAATEQRLFSTRKFYTFALLFSAYFHITTLSVLLAPRWMPGWMRPEVLAQLEPLTSVLVPAPFWHVRRGRPLADDVVTFLHWDDLSTCVASVVWAAALYLEALWATAGSVKGYRGVFNTFVQAASLAAVAGPTAAAAFLVSERDAVVLAAAPVVAAASAGGQKALK